MKIVNQTISKTFNRVAFLIVSGALVMGAPAAHAMMAINTGLSAEVRGMTASASFILNTPCTPYTLDWGDGEVVVQEADEDIMCIQVLQDVTLKHTYEETGDYTIVLTQGEKTSLQEVSIEGEVQKFELTDVEKVTSQWIDPNEMMADEEYTIYTITLKNGEVVKVNAGGFTTEEWRTQQFVEAGYSGDVQALIELAQPVEEEEVTEPETPSETEQETRISLQMQIIELLNRIISFFK